MRNYLKTFRLLFVQSLIVVSNFAILGVFFQPCISILPFTQDLGRCEETASSKCNSSSTCEIEDEYTSTYSFAKQLLSTKKISPILGWLNQNPPISAASKLLTTHYGSVTITNTYSLKDYAGVIRKLE